jgi:hypothetical protein
MNRAKVSIRAGIRFFSRDVMSNAERAIGETFAAGFADV